MFSLWVFWQVEGEKLVCKKEKRKLKTRQKLQLPPNENENNHWD